MRFALVMTVALTATISGAAKAQCASSLLNAWSKCLREAALLYGRGTKESADVVASGVFGRCEKEEFAYHTQIARDTNSSDIDGIFGSSRQMRDQNRDRVIYDVMIARMTDPRPNQ